MDYFDTSIFSLLTGTIAGVVGWFAGKTKRKADNATSFSAALDAFSATMQKINDSYHEALAHNVDLYKKNADLQQEIIAKDNKIEDLEQKVTELKGKIETLTKKIDTLTKQVTTNAKAIKTTQPK